MTTITEQLAATLRRIRDRSPTDYGGDEVAMWRDDVENATEALAAYDALLVGQHGITDEQINELGDRFGFGTDDGHGGFIWFDGNPSEMIRAAIAERGN